MGTARESLAVFGVRRLRLLGEVLVISASVQVHPSTFVSKSGLLVFTVDVVHDVVTFADSARFRCLYGYHDIVLIRVLERNRWFVRLLEHMVLELEGTYGTVVEIVPLHDSELEVGKPRSPLHHEFVADDLSVFILLGHAFLVNRGIVIVAVNGL